MSDIFISYAHEDRETARSLAQILDSLGWGVWWDRTILAGEAFDQVIEEALDSARCVIVIWSQHSVASRWVRTEAEEAARRRVLVPVVIDQVKIPLAFRRIQAENMVGWDGSTEFRAFVKLKAAIEQVVGQAPAEVEAHRQAVELEREQAQERAARAAEARRREEHSQRQAESPESRPEASAPRVAASRQEQRLPQRGGRKTSQAGVRWLLGFGALIVVGSLSWFAWDLYSQMKVRDARWKAEQQKRDVEIRESQARMEELENQVETAQKEKQAEAERRKEQERKAVAAQAEKDKIAEERRKLKEQAAARVAEKETAVAGQEGAAAAAEKDEADPQPDVEAAGLLAQGPAVESKAAEEQAEPAPQETAAANKPVPVPAPGSRFQDKLADGSMGPVMVSIPTGSFTMGDDDGVPKVKPAHTVKLNRPFALSVHEVTFAEYDAFARSTGRSFPKDRWGRGSMPVIYVTWGDGTAYAEWLSEQTGASYRLPSEAEWEYAARARSTSLYWWGNRVGRKKANCDGCKSDWDGKQTAPVGSFPANEFGLSDTAGNVWEWVLDCWNETYAGAPADGTPWLSGNCERRVIRGGSYVDGPMLSRSTMRLERNPILQDSVAGFRVCREL